MVLEDGDFAVACVLSDHHTETLGPIPVLVKERQRHTQRLRNPLPLLARQHHAAKLLVHGVALVEAQAILRDHIQLPPKCREGLPIRRVRVARGMHIGPRAVDGRVDGEGCGVDRLVTLDDLAGFVDEDEVGDAEQAEVRGERVEPWVDQYRGRALSLRDAAVLEAIPSSTYRNGPSESDPSH